MTEERDQPEELLHQLLNQPPRKLVFLARSFGKHALELGNPIPERPLYFLKSPSALITPPAAVRLPSECDTVHYEAEVAVILSAKLTHASVSEAESAIGGWTVLNDVTARSAQAEDGGRFTRAKGYDTFCPISPQVLDHLDWKRAHIQGWLNGVCVQSAPLTDMIFSPGEALAAISQVMTLNPGDLISLGTPSGVGSLHAGDTFEVRLCVESVNHDHDEVLRLTHTVI
jgi:2-keto-4-pentenoate hydratase/2-oxohepta-3-ene-1,7-dioic acid hydratase in catechol pathway